MECNLEWIQFLPSKAWWVDFDSTTKSPIIMVLLPAVNSTSRIPLIFVTLLGKLLIVTFDRIRHYSKFFENYKHESK